MVDMRQIASKTLSPLNRDVQPAQWARESAGRNEVSGERLYRINRYL